MYKAFAAGALMVATLFSPATLAKNKGIVHGIYILSEKNEVEPTFCTASKNHQAIFILPVKLVKQINQLRCPQGISNVRVTSLSEDPGHILVNIDPPKGVTNTLDCDAKADMGMQAIGLNCLRVGQESSSHGMR